MARQLRYFLLVGVNRVTVIWLKHVHIQRLKGHISMNFEPVKTSLVNLHGLAEKA